MPPFKRKSPKNPVEGLDAARLAAIVQSSDDAIVSKTLEGEILTWNTAAERIFGYSAEEMVGASIYKLIPPDLYHEEEEVLQRIAGGESVAHYEAMRLRKDGTLIPVELSVSPVRNAAEQGPCFRPPGLVNAVPLCAQNQRSDAGVIRC